MTALSITLLLSLCVAVCGDVEDPSLRGTASQPPEHAVRRLFLSTVSGYTRYFNRRCADASGEELDVHFAGHRDPSYCFRLCDADPDCSAVYQTVEFNGDSLVLSTSCRLALVWTQPRPEGLAGRAVQGGSEHVLNGVCSVKDVQDASFQAFGSFANYCVDASGNDLEWEFAGDFNIRVCYSLCTADPACSAVEWYPSRGDKCYLHVSPQRAVGGAPQPYYQDALCLPKVSDDHFVALAGACRTATHGAGTYYNPTGSSQISVARLDCGAACGADARCTAYEFNSGSGACEIHTEPVSYGSPVEGTTCYARPT